MKGHAIEGRYKQKDAYDIYYCIRNYPEGIEALAEACRPLLEHKAGLAGYQYIAGKFDSQEGFGPTCVRRFVEGSKVLDDRSPDQWQVDAFGQVDASCCPSHTTARLPMGCVFACTMGAAV